jgi:hypothetical protein|tara:strand:- start:843 stop:977 length:135 start_codon:yes stop_codon:yes gene_type:complete
MSKMSNLALKKEEEIIELLTQDMYDKYLEQKAFEQWEQMVAEND